MYNKQEKIGFYVLQLFLFLMDLNHVEGRAKVLCLFIYFCSFIFIGSLMLFSIGCCLLKASLMPPLEFSKISSKVKIFPDYTPCHPYTNNTLFVCKIRYIKVGSTLYAIKHAVCLKPKVKSCEWEFS